MENLTGGTPPVRYLPCVVPCKLYFSLDDETLMKLTAGYAAGMGCLEATCGALIGAVMTAGILTAGAGTPRYSKEILAKFQQKCGATICRELKGVGTGKVLCECPECVRNAVLALGEVMGIE